ncbi:MAG TPA: hypothetical protein VGD13_11095, partial [Xanthobacteraceae bacterium]
MKHTLTAAVAATFLSAAVPDPAHAGGWHGGGGIAAAAIGGLVLGALIGGAFARPAYAYGGPYAYG